VVLLVSGGHTLLVAMDGHGRYRQLGTTVDDAAGEAFDKVARFLGLGYPGGPAIDRVSLEGDPEAIHFPRAMLDEGFDFSFSGLKTAVALEVERRGTLGPQDVADVAASFEAAAVDVLIARSRRALREQGLARLAVVGGVAANARLRAGLADVARQDGFHLALPPMSLCTDNAVMIAAAGARLLARGEDHGLALNSFSRVPLGAAPWTSE
jgi:N6-L-threonylcarbamoyladenine synthase